MSTGLKEIMEAIGALSDEEQSKALAAFKRANLLQGVNLQREADAEARKQARARLDKSMQAIGKILDEARVVGVVILEHGPDGWTGQVKDKGAKGAGHVGRRAKVQLDDRIRAVLYGWIKDKGHKDPTRDPDACKPSGACEVWVFGEERISATALGFYAIEAGCTSDKAICEMYNHKQKILTGGQARGALNRYDAACESGSVQAKGADLEGAEGAEGADLEGAADQEDADLADAADAEGAADQDKDKGKK